jgi:hypothetical protein
MGIGFYCLMYFTPHLVTILGAREYRMIYRGQSFLAVVWFGSSPSSCQPVVSLQSLPLCRRWILLSGEWGRGGRELAA